jgi:hypothetical protein
VIHTKGKKQCSYDSPDSEILSPDLRNFEPPDVETPLEHNSLRVVAVSPLNLNTSKNSG